MAFIKPISRVEEPLENQNPPWSHNDDDTTHQRQSSSGSRPSGACLETSPGQRRPRPWQTQQRAVSASRISTRSSTDLTSPQATFESPLRSIIVSGVPIASISANTALASLSPAAPSATSAPAFVALTNAGARRMLARHESGLAPSVLPPSALSAHSLPTLQKDLDDPHALPSSSSHDHPYQSHVSLPYSRQTLANDDNSAAAAAAATTLLSRNHSDLRALSNAAGGLNDTSTLTGHLFHHGFVEGTHSDITVVAFGQRYRLHKLLLHRVPFFASAFSGPWGESSAQEMVLYPDKVDSNITQAAFELAIKRIYGTQFPQLEEQEAVGLFATTSWLDMPEVVESSVDSILRQMDISTLHDLIRLVTANYYGKPGDRILASVKAVLCRDGWEMPCSLWDNIPSDLIHEVVGSDPFYVASEWDRWCLATRILNRKLRAKAVEADLISNEGAFLYPTPSSIRSSAIRFESPGERDSSVASIQNLVEDDEPWIALYSCAEIAPLLALLDEGIHYLHLTFEQLQQIRSHRDILGVPVVPEKLIADALWMSMELRQLVLNADEHDLELGLAETATEADLASTQDIKGKKRDDGRKPSIEERNSASALRDGTAKGRKFWIPASDLSCVIGGTREANGVANATTSSEVRRLPPSAGPTNLPWASDYILNGGRPTPQGAVSAIDTDTTDAAAAAAAAAATTSSPRQYSIFPPFRFAAEFPHPATLKDKKRVYSGTVWYAGSLWKLYVQRIHSSKSHQLGVYLHRAKEASDEPAASQPGPGFHTRDLAREVDERISLGYSRLEREGGGGGHVRRSHFWRDEDDGSISNTLHNRPVAGRFEELVGQTSNIVLKDEGPERASGHPNSSSNNNNNNNNNNNSQVHDADGSKPALNWIDSDMLTGGISPGKGFTNRQFNVPTVPPYLDNRPVIKTYFKIYSADKAGRMLSIYESAPEKFVLNKSWGWKSSAFGVEDISGNGIAHAHAHAGSTGSTTTASATATANATADMMGRALAKDVKLRFTCLIGNV